MSIASDCPNPECEDGSVSRGIPGSLHNKREPCPDCRGSVRSERMTEPCPTCGGEGLEYPTPNFSESHPLPAPCPVCVGGHVVSESVIEEMAQAIFELDPTKAHTTWERWLSHSLDGGNKYRKQARAGARVVLEHMEDNE